MVTGVGAVTPLGLGATQVLERWSGGVCGVADGSGRCKDFEPGAVLSRKEIRRTDRYTQLAVAAADEAVAQAGWNGDRPYEPARVATVVGTGIGGVASLEQNVMNELRGDRLSPHAIANAMPNAGPAAIALRYGLKGPNFCVASACAAGASAIGSAMRLIEEGAADAAVTGGAEAPLTAATAGAFATMGATSRSGVARPFDARRDGFVLAEGAGMLVLEEAEAAIERGAEILGEVVGYGASDDAFHMASPDPTGHGAAQAIELALEDAGLRPDDVDYVNAHGTATSAGDRSETEALKAALNGHAMRVPVSSLKSAIGHSLGASGAIEAVVTLLSLRARVTPPTLGWEEPEEGLDLDYVPGGARPLRPRPPDHGAVGLSNSFGFGGHNAVLCLVA